MPRGTDGIAEVAQGVEERDEVVAAVRVSGGIRHLDAYAICDARCPRTGAGRANSRHVPPE